MRIRKTVALFLSIVLMVSLVLVGAGARVAQAAVRAYTASIAANSTGVGTGKQVVYTITVQNTGDEAYAAAEPARVQLGLSGALDDATYTTKASSNVAGWTFTTPSAASPVLDAAGPLANGQTATITFTLTTKSAVEGDRSLRVTADPSVGGGTCTSSAACVSAVPVLRSGIAVDVTTSPGSVTAASSPITFTYVVTNTGDEPLQGVTVSDNRLTVPQAHAGDTDGDGLLDTDETWTYTATQTLTTAQTNTATARGTGATTGVVATGTDTVTVPLSRPGWT